jgi:hypothetical protein
MDTSSNLGYIASLVVGFIGIILLVTTYTYIDKLEKMGCPCSDHPYRSFIKNYAMFITVYILITMFIPPNVIASSLGPMGTFIYMIVKVIISIITFIFFIMAILYVRYLMREKCKCSEDIRRDVLYIWSIIEIALLGIFIMIPIFIMLVGGSIGVALGAAKEFHSSANTIQDITVNPLKHVKKIPGSLKSSVKAASKIIRRR